MKKNTLAFGVLVALLFAASPIPPFLSRAAVYNVDVAPVVVQVAIEPNLLPKVSIWEGYDLLKRICAVESNAGANNEPRQFDPDGTPNWGWDKDPDHPGKWIQVKRDVGDCQINTKVWGAIANAMGLDVVNIEADNVAFAKWLYNSYGTTPWDASKMWWGKD